MTRISDLQRSRFFGPPGNVPKVRVITAWGIGVSCHRLLVPLFLDACDQAAEDVPEWRPRRIDSYNPRRIRGRDEWSIHSWALAWDFFSTGPGVPPPGGVWTPDDPPPAEFVRCFEERGFTWGGRWRRRDLPHFEWAGPPPTGTVHPPPTIPEASRMLNKPVVAIVPTHTEQGYWLVAGDGGVFAFGDAPDVGSFGDKPLNAPVVDAKRTSSSGGLWLACADGGVLTLGDAPFHGSAA